MFVLLIMVDIIKKSIKDLKGVWGIALISSMLLSLLPMFYLQHKQLGLLVILLFSGALRAGNTKVVLCIATKKFLKINYIIEGFSYFKNTLGVFLLSLVFISLGFLFFILPGIIIAIWLSQSFFVLVENPSLEPMDIFKKSRELIKGYELKYFLIFFLFTVLTLALVFVNLSFLALLLAPIQYVVFANFYIFLKSVNND